jgi:hypothetical protein
MNSSIVPIFETDKTKNNSRFFSNQKQQLVAENFQLLRSDIHGIGLFSLADYPRGTEMNVAFNIDQLNYLLEDRLVDNDVPDDGFDAENAIAGDTQLSAIRYMNHSETANIGFYRIKKHLVIARSLKNISFGDEITTDYRFAFALLNKSTPAWIKPFLEPEYEHALTGLSIE